MAMVTKPGRREYAVREDQAQCTAGVDPDTDSDADTERDMRYLLSVWVEDSKMLLSEYSYGGVANHVVFVLEAELSIAFLVGNRQFCKRFKRVESVEPFPVT